MYLLSESLNRRALEAQCHETRCIDDALRVLVGLAGDEEDALRRIRRERRERRPDAYPERHFNAKPANMPVNVILLDDEPVWWGGFEGVDHGWTWRERWLFEPPF